MTHPARIEGAAADAEGTLPLALYRRLLNWSFLLFSSTRLLTYLPTL